jgi:hypothetical protein
MNSDDLIEIVPADEKDPRIQAAVKELSALLLSRFPSASLNVVHRGDPNGIYIIATVDIDDPDEVIEAVLPRMVDMQADEGLPVYVVPEWPLHRIREQLRQVREQRTQAEKVAAVSA